MSMVRLYVNNLISRDKTWYATNYAHVWYCHDKHSFCKCWENWLEWVEHLAAVGIFEYHFRSEMFR